MAALFIVVGSVCTELVRIGQFLIRSGGSFGQCWDYIVQNRQRQLLDRYVQWLDRGGGGGGVSDELDCLAGHQYSRKELSISICQRKYWIVSRLRDTLQREPMDDEIDGFVDLATEIVEWTEVEVSVRNLVMVVALGILMGLYL